MTKIYFRGVCFLVLLLLLVSNATKAQTTHNVTNTEPNALETFIETGTWAAGDIIMLTSAGVYEVADIIDVTKSVTIMGDPSLATRPVINFTTANNTIRANANDLNITIKGIDFNGYRENNTNRANAIFRANSTIDRVTRFALEDSKAWGFIAGIDLNTTNYKTVYDNVLINNVDWSDFGGSTSVYAINLRLSAVREMRVVNSTFHKFQLGFISPPYFSEEPARPTKILQHYLIENNTFYKVAGQNNGSLIQFNDPKDNSIKLTFRNNIVSMLFNPSLARPFRINANAAQPAESGVKAIQFVNNIFHDYNSSFISGTTTFNLSSLENRTDINLANNLTSNPLFASPESGNFSLLAASPARTASTTGGPVGDPQWVVGVHPITNTATPSLEDFIKTGTWAAGDIIMLTTAGVYEIAATVDIPRSVVIMGDPSLATRPVIRFTGTSGSFRGDANNFSIVFSNVDFNGYQSNNTSRTPYIFRGNVTSSTILGVRFEKVVFENSRAWGFQGGLILNNNTHRMVADEVILNNVNWSDMLGAYAINLNQNGVKMLRVTNSTFHNIGNGIVNNPYFSLEPGRPVVLKQQMLFERNTFYKVAGNGNNSLIQINDPKDQSVTLTFRNNVVSTLHTVDSRPFRLDPLAGTFTFTNNVFHNFNTTTEDKRIFNLQAVDEAQTNVTATNTRTEDPGFAAPETGNFKLPNGSPLATAGTDNSLLGDPEWAPDNVTSTKPELHIAKVEVYPNPANDKLYINAASEVEVTVYNLTGSAVWKGAVNRSGSIDIAAFKAGLYIVRIDAGSYVQSVKVLKQ